MTKGIKRGQVGINTYVQLVPAKISTKLLREKIADSMPADCYAICVEIKTDSTREQVKIFTDDLDAGQPIDQASGRDWKRVVKYAKQLLSKGWAVRVFFAGEYDARNMTLNQFVDINAKEVA